MVRSGRTAGRRGPPAGGDRPPRGKVTDRLDVPLEDAILAFGKQVYLLGNDRPGATIRVELTSDRNLSGYLKGRQGRYLPDQPWNDRDLKIDRVRPDGRAPMFHDSGATWPTERVRVRGFRCTSCDLTGQLALAAADARGPDQAPGGTRWCWTTRLAPKIDPVTLVHIICRSIRQAAEGVGHYPPGRRRGDTTATVGTSSQTRNDTKASPMIETHDLTKMYGELYALNRLNLKLEQGDVYGFIGPNGSGKTTTMRILATLLNPPGARRPSAATRFTRGQGDPPR